MQFFAASTLALFLASGAVTSDDPLGGALVEALNKMGVIYQLGKECGASEEVLSNFEALTVSDIAEMKQNNADLNIDFDQVYANGKELGAKKFAELGAGAKSSETCSKAIFTVTRM